MLKFEFDFLRSQAYERNTKNLFLILLRCKFNL